MAPHLLLLGKGVLSRVGGAHMRHLRGLKLHLNSRQQDSKDNFGSRDVAIAGKAGRQTAWQLGAWMHAGDVVTIRHRPPHGVWPPGARGGCLNEKQLLCEG